MDRINTATKATDKWGSGKHGFTEGDPQAGVADTELDAAFFDGVQEEIVAPIEHVGRATDPDDLAQLLKAIRDLFQLANWTVSYPDAATNMAIAWRPLASGRRFVVADGANSFKRSDDGITWTSYGGLGPFTEVYELVRGATYFWATGNSSLAGVYRSTDGVSWSGPYALGGTDYHGIVAVEGTAFATVGLGGSIYTSTSGTSWTVRTSGTANNLRAVARRSDGVLVAVGDAGTITRSANLTTWATQTSGTADDLFGVAVATSGPVAGRFVAGGDNGTIIYSDDGTSWSAASATASASLIQRVRWSTRHAVFLACDETAILVSRDGDTWVRVLPVTGDQVRDVVEDDHGSVAVGWSGIVMNSLRSFDLLAP